MGKFIKRKIKLNVLSCQILQHISNQRETINYIEEAQALPPLDIEAPSTSTGITAETASSQVGLAEKSKESPTKKLNEDPNQKACPAQMENKLNLQILNKQLIK